MILLLTWVTFLNMFVLTGERVVLTYKKTFSFIKAEKMVQKTYYKTKDYCKVKFAFTAENAETIEILGLNSDWENSVIMKKKKDGTFSAEVNLPKETKHEFKYLVNDTLWINEPEADGQEANAFGGNNSLLVI